MCVCAGILYNYSSPSLMIYFFSSFFNIFSFQFSLEFIRVPKEARRNKNTQQVDGGLVVDKTMTTVFFSFLDEMDLHIS